MRSLLTELRHAVRSLRKSPALAAAGIASLALGIGANVTIYSVVREMILDDFSARQPDRLARVDAQVPYTAYRDLRSAAIFQDVAFDTGLGDLQWNLGTHSELAWQMSTSANFFDVLGVRASTGRLYSQADDGTQSAVVSYAFWRKRLHADPAASGGQLQLNGRLYTVLGVLPRDYRSVMGHGVSPEVYLVAGSDSGRCRLFGRLRDGVTREQARQAWVAAAQTIGGADFAKRVSVLRPMGGLAANAAGEGDNLRYFVFFAMLFGTAAMLAAIACMNVAGLLLARGVSRQRELAIRRALGASRFQIAQPLLAEGLVLVGLGVGAGLLVDAWLRNWLSTVRWPSAYNVPIEFHFQSDRGLFLYAMATALAALLVSSVIPALRGSNADLGLAMKQGEPAFSIRRWSLRNSFVASQVALSLVLLVLGVLFGRSFLRVAGVDPGFDVSHTLIVQVHPMPGQARGDQRLRWRDGVVQRVQDVAGVIGVTSIGTLPFMGELPQDPVRRQGAPLPEARDAYSVGGGEQFCKVLGIRILRGRDFEIADRLRQPAPAIVNQTMARRLFGDADPVGGRFLVGRENVGREKERVFEVIGVAADTRMRTLGEDHAPLFFTPFADAQLLVRVAGSPAQWIPPLRKALDGVEMVAFLDVRPLADAAAGAVFPMRVAAGFVGSLSGVGLLLVLGGLYSSVSYATRRRTREMAIRAAVGATRGRILWTAARDGVTVLACGAAVGLPLAVAAIRPLTELLPDGLDPWDPALFLAVALVLLATGAVASWLPARGAAAVDPALALRQE